MSAFQSKVRKHGSHQIECKTYYPFTKDRKNTYIVVLYYFFPQKLNINKRQYNIQHILQDLTTFTRFSSPSMRIEDMLNEEYPTSPFVRIQGYLNEVIRGREIVLPGLEHECKTLVNTFRTAMSRKNREIRKAIPSERIDLSREYETVLIQFFSSVHRLLSELSQLLPSAATIIQWTTEALSIVCIKYISILVQHKKLQDEQSTIRDLFRSLLLEQQQYLQELGYIRLTSEGFHVSNNYVYRCGELKRWSQSALYLEIQRHLPSIGSVHVVAGLAAAIAMIFSVAAAAFAIQFFQSYSIPWILIIVISYIFKDRIKEILRNALLKFFPRVLTDRTVRLVDPGVGKKVGNSQTTVEHLTIEELPKNIQAAWRVFHHPLSDSERQENVLRIKKKVCIDSKKILKQHSRVHGVSEITRMKTNEWRKEMDDRTDIYLFSGEGFSQKILPKMYHIPFLLELKNSQGDFVNLQCFQILLNKDGIVNIQKVHNTDGDRQ